MRVLHLAPFIVVAMLNSNSVAETVAETQKQPERFQAKIINHADGADLSTWLRALTFSARGDLHSIVLQSRADGSDRKFLESFNILLDPPTPPAQDAETLTMTQIENKWKKETLLEIIDGVPSKTAGGDVKWDSFVYIGYLGDVIGTDNLHLVGEHISADNLQNSLYVAESIIIFLIVENVIKSTPTDESFICDLLSKDRTYLVSLRLNNDFSSQLRADLSDSERSVIDTLTKAWEKRKKEHKCPDVGVIDAKE
jgi:hypothetical protein